MKVFVFFALIAIFVGGNESVVVDCEFNDYGANSFGYNCNVKNAELITSRDDREITGIRGKHLSGKTDDDVVGFNAVSKKVNFFPRGLTKFFKNIKTIGIYESNLQEITKDDFKDLRQKLEVLYLHDNKIKHIEDGTFSELEILKSFYLFSNPCTSDYDYAFNNRTQVLELIRNVEASCKDPKNIPATSTTTENPKIVEKNQEIIILTSNLTTTLEILDSQKYEIQKLSEENLKFKLENSENLNLKDEILKLLEINQKIIEENKTLKEKSEIEKEILQKIEQFEGKISSKLDQKASEILISTLTQKIEQLEEILIQKTEILSQKCIELDEKFEKMPLKVADESKKYFEDLKVDQRISIIAQEAMIKSNLEKSLKNLKHYGAQVSTMRSELGIKIEEFCQK